MERVVTLVLANGWSTYLIWKCPALKAYKLVFRLPGTTHQSSLTNH